METIKVQKITNIAELESLPKNKIEKVNWFDSYPYAPKVDFIIAHTGTEILLKFFIQEQSILALTTENNDKVCTDSCVEFFINFDETGYYNFEFNCIGTALIGFRKEKNNSVRADKKILEAIERESTLGDTPFSEKMGDKKWELALNIPVSSFFKHDIQNLSGMKANANFYKCGDNLSVPHFVSWNPINNPTPNFHLEKFFGEITFE